MKTTYTETRIPGQKTLNYFGSFFHLCTSENYQVIFSNNEEYKIGITILAICSRLYSEIRFLTLQLMSNHLHFVINGEKKRIEEFFQCYTHYLERALSKSGRVIDLSGITMRLFEIDDAMYLKNTIVYTHRNPMIANGDTIPFNSWWGAGYLFFNPSAVQRVKEQGKTISQRYIQQLSCGRKFDGIKDLIMVDGYASPLCFCDIAFSENIFSNARDYLYCLTKNIESNKEIAAQIGESITYTDSELYSVVIRKARDKFNCGDIRLLPMKAKMDLIRSLHFDYNASNKQICRILKIDISVVNTIF